MNPWIQVVSLLGAGLVLAGFLALQKGWWRSHSPGYLWANFLGSFLLTGVAVWDRRAGFVLLEGAWAVISLGSLLRTRTADARVRDP